MVLNLLSLLVSVAAVLVALLVPPWLTKKASGEAYRTASQGWLAVHQSGIEQQRFNIEMQVKDRARGEVVTDLSASITWLLEMGSYGRNLDRQWDTIAIPDDKDARLREFYLKEYEELATRYESVMGLVIRLRAYKYVFPISRQLLLAIIELMHEAERDCSSIRWASLGLTIGAALDDKYRPALKNQDGIGPAVLALSELRGHINREFYSDVIPDNPVVAAEPKILSGIVNKEGLWVIESPEWYRALDLRLREEKETDSNMT
jgi:hypothetical protein